MRRMSLSMPERRLRSVQQSRGDHPTTRPSATTKDTAVSPNEQARKNHDELFAGHVSRLAVTDPELIEYFDNFAFDEVLRYGTLDTRTPLMVQLAALIACQAVSEFRVTLGAALTVGVTPVEAKETVYQAVPYVGMGKVFDFLHATNDVLTERDVTLPLPGQSTTTPDRREEKTWRCRRRSHPQRGPADR
jgi:4-carboxymuconolactone decarboxylase